MEFSDCNRTRWLLVACRRGLVCCAASAMLIGAARRATAYEQVAAFVDAMCSAGYYDTAIDYLDTLKSASYISDDMRASLPYRQGDVLMRQAEATNDAGVKAKLLSEAADKIRAFLQQSPPADLAAAAAGRLATIEVEKARSLATVARTSPAGTRDSKLAEAREMFDQARKQLASAETQFAAALDAMPKLFAAGEEDKKQRKNELAAELAKTQFTLASIDYELAKTHEPGSAEAKAALGQAAERFTKLYDQYRTRGAGLIALLWAGRCQQELGDTKKALGAYQDLLDLPGKSSEVRSIRAKALRQALEVWSLPDERKYEEAINRGNEWILAETRTASNDPDGLAIRYLTALATQKHIAALNRNSADYRRSQQAALRLVKHVARYPGEFKRPAAQLAESLGGGADSADAEPTTFAAARQRAVESLERMQNARMGRDISKQTGEEEQIALYDKQEAEAKADAVHYFKLALQLDLAGAPIEDVNSTRYYVCYFLYEGGQYIDAAVVGEYLARSFPNSAEGRQGARLAMASWVKAYTDSREADKSFEMARINALADLILKHWPDQPEAAEAAATQLSFAIQRRDLEKVLSCLEQIPADNPRRADSEMRAGQALWASYLKSLFLPEEERPGEEELTKLKTKAFEILQAGVERMKEQAQGQATPTLMAALLSLAQINLEMGNTATSLEVLEDESLGPLALLRAGNPVVAENPALPVEVYKLALRAYVASDPPRIEDAERVMNDLEQAVKASGDAQASETLTRIYISLGRELQQQLDELRASKKTKELKTVSQGFETFLSRIMGRSAGNTWSSLAWVAETFFSLGSGFDDPAKGPSPDGVRYFEQAAKAYDEMLSRATADPGFAPNPDALVGVQLRSAMCLRKLGKYDESLAKIAAVLKARPSMLPAQMMGAETYQAKGAIDKEAYAHAILGGTEKDAKNQPVIWGWAKLSKLTMSDERFADTFHQSRIKMAESRYLYGRKNSDKAKGKRTINAAKEDLWITYKLYPDLGGEARSQEYNRLLVQIQRALGEKTAGLEEFRRRAAAANKAATAAGG